MTLLVALLASLAPATLSQTDTASPSLAPTLGPTERVCACTPTIYRWVLNFANFCPPPNVTICPTCGITDLFCDIKPDDEAVNDTVPVVVESYTVLELDAAFQVIKQYSRGGLELPDGGEIEYVSITATGETIPVEDRPAGLQMTVDGRNRAGEELQSSWIVEFSRRCDVLPFQEGDSISWSVFSDLVPPRPELCDVSPPPTEPPTSVPTVEPTPEPTEAPTRQPVTDPTTESPTEAPVVDPTTEPTPEPTPEPTDVPTPDPILTLVPITPVTPSPTTAPNAPPTATKSPTPRPATPSPSASPTQVMSMGYGRDSNDNLDNLFLDWPMDDMDALSESSADKDEYGRSSMKKSRKRDSREGGHTDMSERSDKNVGASSSETKKKKKKKAKPSSPSSESETKKKNKGKKKKKDTDDSSSLSSTDRPKGMAKWKWEQKVKKRGRSKTEENRKHPSRRKSHTSSSSGKREEKKRKKPKDEGKDQGSSSSSHGSERHKKGHKNLKNKKKNPAHKKGYKKRNKSKGRLRRRRRELVVPIFEYDGEFEYDFDLEYDAVKEDDKNFEELAHEYDILRRNALDAVHGTTRRKRRGWREMATRRQ